jgi:hypothetical protein
LATALTVGVGLTVIVKVIGVPVQPFAAGITVIVATTGDVPAFIAVNEAMSPVPFAASPMVGWSFVHAKVVPATGPPKVMAVVVAPLQYAALPIGLTAGVGLTVIVKDIDVPVHPLADGITLIIAITGVVPVLFAVNETMFPVPLNASPIDGSLLVHEYVVPATGPLKLIGAVFTPLQ